MEGRAPVAREAEVTTDEESSVKSEWWGLESLDEQNAAGR